MDTEDKIREETRTKTIEYKVYIASDGQEFTSKKECQHYQDVLLGKVKTCPTCNGKGKLYKEIDDENYHTGAPEKTTIWYTCPDCGGKGYLTKKVKIVETWE